MQYNLHTARDANNVGCRYIEDLIAAQQQAQRRFEEQIAQLKENERQQSERILKLKTVKKLQEEKISMMQMHVDRQQSSLAVLEDSKRLQDTQLKYMSSRVEALQLENIKYKSQLDMMIKERQSNAAPQKLDTTVVENKGDLNELDVDTAKAIIERLKQHIAVYQHTNHLLLWCCMSVVDVYHTVFLHFLKTREQQQNCG